MYALAVFKSRITHKIRYRRFNRKYPVQNTFKNVPVADIENTQTTNATEQ